jgi:hypothetical protein
MKIIIFSIVLFSVMPFIVYGQKKATVTLPKDSKRINIDFNIERLVVSECFQDSLGFIKTNNNQPIVFKDTDALSTLNAFVRDVFVSSSQENIIVRVNKILVVEENASFKLSASLSFIQVKDGEHNLLSTIIKESTEEQPKTSDVFASKLRGEFVGSLIIRIIKEFNSSYKNGIIGEKIDNEDILSCPKIDLKDLNGKQGVIPNYSSALYNQYESIDFSINKIKIVDSLIIYQADKFISNSWGVLLNDTLYKSLGKYLYRIQSNAKGEYYFFAPPHAEWIELSASFNPQGLGFLLVGGTTSAVLIGTKSTNPLVAVLIGVSAGLATELIVFLIRRNKKMEMIKYQIDIITGLAY